MIPTDDEPAIGPAEPVEPTPPQPPAVTSSRPVMGLVALATSLLVLLVAIWWTGAAAPRVRVHHTSSSGEADPATGWAYASFEITNDGRFPVAVRSVALERERKAGEARLYLRDPDVPAGGRAYPVNPSGLVGRVDLAELAPFELAGGTSREVVALFEVRCPGDWPTGAEVEVRSRLGITRTERLDGPPLGTWSTPTSC